MTEVKYRDWVLEVDPENTRRIYTSMERGGAEECGCDPYRNFSLNKEQNYPGEVLDLFQRLGIDYRREVEAYHMARLDSGLHLYGGWVHFTGRIKEGRHSSEKVDETFTIDFMKNRDLAFKAFAQYPLVQVEFVVELAWILKDIKAPD